MTEQDKENLISLPDGTVIGRVEPWADDPNIFDGWLEPAESTDELLINGADRDGAALEVVRVYLVGEIKIQEKSEQGQPGHEERNARIIQAFQIMGDLTRKILDEAGEAATR